MHWLASALLVVAMAPMQEPRRIPREEREADLFQLTETFTSLHAGLLRYASAAEMEETFGAAMSAVQDGPDDVLTFYRTVAELVAAVHCGHTRVRLGERDREAALAARGLLPFEVRLVGERAWLARVLDDSAGLRAGEELLAIDGRPVAEIRAQAMARLSGDGFIESGRERELEADFATLHSLLVDEVRTGPYELRLAGRAEPLQVRGLAPDEFRKRRGPPVERPLVALEVRAEPRVGILTVSAFQNTPAGEPSFLAQLENAFRRLREEKVPHLVLDLRGNGGGIDMFGVALVSYLGSEPFRYFERIEVTPDYRGSVRIVERDGRRLMLSHDGLDPQPAAELHFQGRVWILMDGETFSTASDVVSVSHATKRATFLGEECGGGYEGNNSGDSTSVLLAGSGLNVSVPEWNYTTAGVAPEHHGRGVRPDIAVTPSIEDVLAGRDAVLERALAEIRAH